MAKDYSNMTKGELLEANRLLGDKRDALKDEQRKIQVCLNAFAAQDEAKKAISGLSDAGKKAARQVLGVPSIPSEEVVGKPGATK